MKKIYYTFFGVTLLLVSTSSCDLETGPSNAMTPEAVGSSIINIRAANNGNYAKMLIQDFVRNINNMPEYQSDELCLSGVTTSPLFYTYSYNHLLNQANQQQIWDRLYQMISGTNLLLPQIDQTLSAEHAHIKGENLFLRAWAHFHLVNIFSRQYMLEGVNPAIELGIPVVTKYSLIDLPKRNTLKETYDSIIKDLLEAADLMTMDKSCAYVSKEVAYALLSRVYLYTGNYSESIKYSNLVINSGRYQLTKGQDFVNYQRVEPETNKENIFVIKFTLKDDLDYGSLGSQWNGDGGYGEVYVSTTHMKLLNKYPEDLRQKQVAVQFTADKKDTLRRNGFPKIFMYKYSYQGGKASMSSPAQFRLAEMYLNRAECNAKLGNYAAAIDDINVIRQRANLSGSALYSITDLKGHASVLDVVLEERKLELAFEGYRHYDLLRNNKTMIRDYAGVHPKDPGTKNTQTILPTNPRNIHFLPEKELLLNPNLVNNPN